MTNCCGSNEPLDTRLPSKYTNILKALHKKAPYSTGINANITANMIEIWKNEINNIDELDNILNIFNIYYTNLFQKKTNSIFWRDQNNKKYQIASNKIVKKFIILFLSIIIYIYI